MGEFWFGIGLGFLAGVFFTSALNYWAQMSLWQDEQGAAPK